VFNEIKIKEGTQSRRNEKRATNWRKSLIEIKENLEKVYIRTIQYPVTSR
jgi:hypothetical protein